MISTPPQRRDEPMAPGSQSVGRGSGSVRDLPRSATVVAGPGGPRGTDPGAVPILLTASNHHAATIGRGHRDPI